MGQQQLLLLVLSTVIVGLATVAGIQAFEQGSTRANQDALTNTAVKIASDMQANLQEPAQFGGQGVDDLGSDTPQGDGTIDLEDLGYQTESSAEFLSAPVYSTSDGECQITAGDASTNPLEVTCESAENRVVVEVQGTDSEDIVTTTQETKSSS